MTVGWTTDTVTPDIRRALHYTLLWGLDGVVLRSVGAGRVPFVNEGPLRKRLIADDLPVLAIDPGILEGDLSARASWMNEIASFEETASFCARLGIDTVLVGALASASSPYDETMAADALRQLGDVVERAGLRLAVRNERGTSVQTGAALASLLKHVSHGAVGADWRPFDALRAGESPSAGLSALLPVARLFSVTVRDESPDGAPAVPERGLVDWEQVLRLLSAEGWDGLLNLEMHGRPAGAFGLHSASAMISAVRRA